MYRFLGPWELSGFVTWGFAKPLFPLCPTSSQGKQKAKRGYYVNKPNQILERRGDKRFHVQTGVLAEPNTCVTRVSHIIDVSLGGISFTYVARQAWAEESGTLNILFPLRGFFLLGVPFQTAYDFATANTFSRLPIRRRGGRFGRLTQEQLSYLKYFISHFTLGEVKAQPYPVVKWEKNSPLTVPLSAPEAQPSDRTFDLW